MSEKKLLRELGLAGGVDADLRGVEVDRSVVDEALKLAGLEDEDARRAAADRVLGRVERAQD